MNEVENKLEELREIIFLEQAELIRTGILDDIVAGLASIDWREDLYTSDIWPAKIDSLIDEISSKIGGEGKFGYMIVYFLQRLITRGTVIAKATSWPVNETGETRYGDLAFRSVDECCEEWRITLDGKDDLSSLSIEIEAR